ncbi:menaquinone-dependent protoporphyrinogen oxidase [Cognatiyoonia koreensis]|uniref:Menaquinone-dependent protoporphyrinogen oxidase n=1 Tax=Cognatiyoonia koreensis TaxID=364200 RepID=A0A1I0S1L5_9RHOB|nr:flavodoxin domain-containing protein [Cognatiyoonia koreensis]SEW47219.1 menaquinone-dependent protoporphyrinogen oxidase [Cognatiyoonia koreensis]
MAVLIEYGTIEGQTGKIANFIADHIQSLGQDVTLVNTGDRAAPPASFDGVDKVILAASVHERRHPKMFETTIAAQRDDLAQRPTLLLSVSLNAAFPEGVEEAQEYVEEMELRTGLTPTEEMLVPGAVHTDRCDYYALQVLRHVILRGKDYDPAQGTHEFTDWDALRDRVSAFVAA